MSARERMLADRRIRDSAKTVVMADLEFLKGDLARKGLGERAADRIKSGALDVYDEAFETAADNKGVIAAVVAAIAVWLARNPLLALFGLGESDDAGDEADCAEHAPCPDR